MDYKKIKLNNYNVHLIKTDKFKTITVQINFKRKIEKDELTIRRMLTKTMFEGTKKYPTNRLIEKELEELYSAYIGVSNVISGNYDVMSFHSTFLNENYTETGMNKKTLEFLLEMILNPNVKDNQFDEYNFDLAKRDISNNIKTKKENLYNYTVTRMFEKMDKNSSNAYWGCGYKKNLNKVTPQNLYEYYKKVMHEDIIDICIVGDINDDIIDIFKEKFETQRQIEELGHFQICKKFNKKEKIVIEEEKINQSKLIMTYSFKNLTEYELKYVSIILSFILGGSGDSLLFKEVREKNSLCYNINSSFLMLSGVLYVYSGIESKNYDKTVKLIKKMVEKLKKGEFEQRYIDNAKTLYRNSFIELEDSPRRIISHFISNEYLKYASAQERLEILDTVKKEDVMNMAKKMNLNIIYMLKGEDNEENI